MIFSLQHKIIASWGAKFKESPTCELFTQFIRGHREGTTPMIHTLSTVSHARVMHSPATVHAYLSVQTKARAKCDMDVHQSGKRVLHTGTGSPLNPLSSGALCVCARTCSFPRDGMETRTEKILPATPRGQNSKISVSALVCA